MTFSFGEEPKPFKVDIPKEEVDELHQRLENARWPSTDTVVDDMTPEEQNEVFGMGKGPTLPLMKELAAEWKNHDWEKAQALINKFNHFKVGIEDIDLHFLHHRSTREDAVPIILCHGWPGSFLEFLHTIPLLTEPKEAGAQAFHVVVPSMPGYAFSSPPKTSKWVMNDTARIFDKLMVGLGYTSYVAQGGDWGSVTARLLGSLHKDHCKGVHLNFCPVPTPSLLSWINPHTLLAWAPEFLVSKKEYQNKKRTLSYLEKGSAYYVMQHLTPRTPAYALNDSPIGLLAWIGEKMIPYINHATTRPNPTLTRDALFETLSLYWFTHSIGTSFLPYALNPHFGTFIVDPKYYIPNLALSNFPGEIVVPTEKEVKRTANLRWFKEADDGGHFAALEKPGVFVDHLREAVSVLLK
ncbi:epoxide hydrolase family protein [Sporobolomyces salmoneus]|uniref:epoxide hydrolase family protein n=1 Tax=Sporobolomyces salmoneus TaxID=183962 RepID=UPI00317B2608